MPGDRVALVSQTRLEWVLADVGILLAGGVTVPIYPQSTPEQCEFIIRDAGAKLVIVEDAAQLAKLAPMRHRLFTVTRLIHIAGDATLEKPDAQGRTKVTLAEVSHGASDFLFSRWTALRGRRQDLDGRPRGRARLALGRGRPRIRCSRSSTPRGRPGRPRGWC